MKNSLLPYCERLNTAAELVNVISNLGFLAVSLILICLFWRRTLASASIFASASSLPKRSQIPPALWTLSLLPMLVGLGSASYHFMPSSATLILDLAAIGLFAGASLYLCLRHVMRYSPSRAGILFMAWLVATVIAAPWPAYFFGSLIYLPTFIALLLVAFASRNQLIVAASLMFALALLLRSLDLPLCEQVTSGTHPLWHLLAAFVSFLLVLALRDTMSAPPCDQLHPPLQSHKD